MRPYLWMVIGSFSFAVMGALAHSLRETCDWQIVALARTSLALLFGLGLAMSAGVRLVVLRPPTLWVRSIFGSLGVLLCFYAFARLPVADVMTLTNMYPIWVALLAWPVLRQRPTAGVWLAVASGVAGVALVQQPHFAAGDQAWIAALAASFTAAVAMIGLHRLHWIDSRAIVVHFSAVSVLACLGSFAVFPQSITTGPLLRPDVLARLLGCGAAATLGQIGLTKAFATGEPARVSILGLTQVAFALALDYALWHRPVGMTTVAGIALILAPAAWLLAGGARIAPRSQHGDH